jgi:hypothetical protein
VGGIGVAVPVAVSSWLPHRCRCWVAKLSACYVRCASAQWAVGLWGSWTQTGVFHFWSVFPRSLCRHDQPVCHSNGVLRPDSAGAATRRKFVKLLGVGAGTAHKWWDLGMR